MLARAWFTAAVVLLTADLAFGGVLESLESEIRTLADRACPAVVRVEGTCRRTLSFTARPGQAIQLTPSFTECTVGSGFVVGPQRMILTSSRIVEGAVAVRVTFRNGKTVDAEVVGGDEFFRVAVLKAEVPEDIRPLELSEREPSAGSFALHCGNARNVRPRLALGLVCDTGRSYLEYDNFTVVSVPLTPGDSGAPFIGSDGRVLGMGSATLTEVSRSSQSRGTSRGVIIKSSMNAEPGRLACCVPAADLRFVLKDIVEHGRVQKAWLGVTLQQNEPRVTGVVDESPAHAAGLRPADRVVAMDGRPVANRMDLIGRLVRLRPGTVVTLLVDRDGTEIKVRVPLTLRPEETPADLLLVAEGVEVIQVPENWRTSPLRVGDVIVGIDGKPVRDTESVRKTLAGFTGETKLVIEYLRNGWKGRFTNK
jgi:S1-C subfamily serine protease